jgi:hypothetical protein
MEGLVDEAEASHTNIANLNALSQSLGVFNGTFASYPFVVEMNAIDWAYDSRRIGCRYVHRCFVLAMRVLMDGQQSRHDKYIITPCLLAQSALAVWTTIFCEAE